MDYKCGGSPSFGLASYLMIKRLKGILGEPKQSRGGETDNLNKQGTWQTAPSIEVL